MTFESSDYKPISCSFHDILEHLAITRMPAQISFVDAHGLPQQRHASVRDVYSRHGAEWVVLSSGETLRLDQLRAVDDARLADFD